MTQLNQLLPPCTDKDIPDQTGKVFIVTGGTSGVGFEVSRILYEKNATVYVAARAAFKIETAIEKIRNQYPNSQGRLEALVVDLTDLATIKPAVDSFISKEKRLDVLFNNAGVMGTSPDEKSVQGYKLQMGTNALGPFLFTRLLESILLSTAAQKSPSSSPSSVRVVWGAVFKGPTYGAYTELFAGFSSDITSEDNGRYIIPWGRLGSVPEHMVGGMRSREEGGTGSSEKF